MVGAFLKGPYQEIDWARVMCVIPISMLILGMFFVGSAIDKKVTPGETISSSEYRALEWRNALIALLIFVKTVVKYYQYHYFLSLVAGTVIVVGGFLGHLMLNPKLGLVYKKGFSKDTFIIAEKAKLIMRAFVYVYAILILFVICFI